MKQLSGVELVREVIKVVRAKGFVEVFGRANVDTEIEPKPMPPDALEKLRLDGGLQLTPSLREWLAFDTTFFEWFDARSKLRVRKLPELLKQWQYPKALGCLQLARTLITRDCYWVPLGDESMRFVYPSAPDVIGELPVMLLDIDDMPQISVGYPGVDVYLGAHAGLLEKEWWKRKAFAQRMKHHEKAVLRGNDTVEYGDDLFPPFDASDAAPMGGGEE